MEIVISIAAKIAEYMVAPIGQWLCYSFHYNNNIENMKNQVVELENARDRVQHSVDAAIRNGEEIEAVVNTWLTKVDAIKGKAMEVLEDEEKAKMRSSNGACLNWKLRHQQSKKAKKIVKEIDEALINGKFDKISHRPATQGFVTMRYMHYMNFESRMSTLKGLMEALRDANINMIGVWGMPGAGKTTLVTEVAKQAEEEKLFDDMAMAVVTQSPDLKKIQGEIADMLDLKLDKETEAGRASRLWERLTKDRKVLVILDDVWEKLDLVAIGIPHNGCKVVLTSRNKDILSCEMGTQMDFELNDLSKEEAWSWFQKMVGDSLKDPNLQSIATQVCEECANLPLALVTVATALKNKRLSEWKDALRQLRRPSPRPQNRMQESIYSAIKLSYNHLESPELRSFFLLCGQIDFMIFYQDLIKYCFGLCLFQDISTLEEVRDRVYTLVRSLKDSCLLLEDPHTSEYVRMHDLVRDVAILIAKAENVLLMRNDDPIKWPDEDARKICTAISVFSRDIHELPDRFECPKLRLLYVHGKARYFKISDTFFKGISELKVLDFTKMRLSSLPSSINLLTNLQTLCLDQCLLGDIAMIGELKSLEILSLLSSEFKQLPREIGNLTRLRLLDLSNCTKLEVIPPNVLSCLIRLEELFVGNSFTQWEVEGLNNERASLAELKHLSQLTTLELHIPDAKILPKDMLFGKLQRYKIFIGDVWEWSDRNKNSRTLKLKLNTSFQLGREIKMLLNGIEDLCLDELKGVESIIYELDTEGFQQLKHLHVQNNVEIKYIINSRGLVIDDVAFPSLEIFSVKNMINLEEICHGKLPLASFRNIRVVKVEHCDKLKFVFTSSIAKGLSQLQELEIRECSIMGAIVIKEEGVVEDRDMILFPQLRHSVLHRLPKLMSFLSTQNSVINDAGDFIPERDLDFHMPILQEQVVFSNLETLELSFIDLEGIQHNQHGASSSCKITNNIQTELRFKNLRSLKVQGSSSLKYLLPSSTTRFMVHLKSLFIEDCKVMEEILLTEDLGEEEIIPKVLFPRLENLILKDLPILKRFYIGSHIKFPFLKYLQVEKCPKLKSFIFKPISSSMNSEDIPYPAMQTLFNEEVAFLTLETLEISHMENLKIIWHNQIAEDSFLKLQNLTVQYCGNLMNIFQSNMLTRFQSLQKLFVDNCGSLQEIFELQEQDVRETHAVTAIPLKDLHLYRLPKMTHVWNKDPQGIFNFHYLQKIYVVKCESLKTLFPASLAGFLVQLEDLQLFDCGVEEIVAHEDGAEVAARLIMFPRVTLLILGKLPKLKWFYQGVHTSVWPLLKHLEMYRCPQIEIFASKNLSSQETVEQSQLETSIQHPLFLVEEGTFPNLEDLVLAENHNMKEIHRGGILEECFCKLKVLEVINHPAISDWSTFLKRLRNLEKLVVRETFWEEIFPHEEFFDQENHSRILTQLRELEIVSKCPEMKIFCHGVLSTPKLERVQATKEDEWHWKVDLNTTVRTLALEGQTMKPPCNSSSE